MSIWMNKTMVMQMHTYSLHISYRYTSLTLAIQKLPSTTSAHNMAFSGLGGSFKWLTCND